MGIIIIVIALCIHFDADTQVMVFMVHRRCTGVEAELSLSSSNFSAMAMLIARLVVMTKLTLCVKVSEPLL